MTGIDGMFSAPKIYTDGDGRHTDEHGREYRLVEVGTEVTYVPTEVAILGATPGVDFAAAVGVYEATERTAWEVYDATRRTAWEVYEATWRPAREVYEATWRPAWEVYDATRRPAREVYDATERTAREVLAEAVSTDPLGAWIMSEIFEDYQAEALIVLAALPCTADTLHALAAEADWCGAWEGAWSRAVAAGVIPVDGERVTR